MLISAVCISVLLAVADWSVPPTFQMYVADVMPVEAVWQVKVKLLPSSTVPEALLLIVGAWGTTARKDNLHWNLEITMEVQVLIRCLGKLNQAKHAKEEKKKKEK